jgi:fucose 4-O-acetylase-like acetyltransferase
MDSAKRLEWIDTLKGFAILLVVMGHVLHTFNTYNAFPDNNIGVVAEKVIYSFHMPLFIMISGFVFATAYSMDKPNNKSRYITQLVNIAMLYFLWSIIFSGIKIIGSRWVNNEITLLNFALMPIKAIDIFWYLYVLFFLYIIGRTYIHFGGAKQSLDSLGFWNCVNRICSVIKYIFQDNNCDGCILQLFLPCRYRVVKKGSFKKRFNSRRNNWSVFNMLGSV